MVKQLRSLFATKASKRSQTRWKATNDGEERWRKIVDRGWRIFDAIARANKKCGKNANERLNKTQLSCNYDVMLKNLQQLRRKEDRHSIQGGEDRIDWTCAISSFLAVLARYLWSPHFARESWTDFHTGLHDWTLPGLLFGAWFWYFVRKRPAANTFNLGSRLTVHFGRDVKLINLAMSDACARGSAGLWEPNLHCFDRNKDIFQSSVVLFSSNFVLGPNGLNRLPILGL